MEEFRLPSAALNPFLPPCSCPPLQRDSSFPQVTIETRVRKTPTVALDLNHETREGAREGGGVGGPASDIGVNGGETARKEAGGKEQSTYWLGEQRMKAPLKYGVTHSHREHTPRFGSERGVMGRSGGVECMDNPPTTNKRPTFLTSGPHRSPADPFIISSASLLAPRP